MVSENSPAQYCKETSHGKIRVPCSRSCMAGAGWVLLSGASTVLSKEDLNRRGTGVMGVLEGFFPPFSEVHFANQWVSIKPLRVKLLAGEQKATELVVSNITFLAHFWCVSLGRGKYRDPQVRQAFLSFWEGAPLKGQQRETPWLGTPILTHTHQVPVSLFWGCLMMNSSKGWCFRSSILQNTQLVFLSDS